MKQWNISQRTRHWWSISFEGTVIHKFAQSQQQAERIVSILSHCDSLSSARKGMLRLKASQVRSECQQQLFNWR